MKKRHFNLSPETTTTTAPTQDSNSPSYATYAATATKQTSSKAKPTRKKDCGEV
jgi:hypothetical protein